MTKRKPDYVFDIWNDGEIWLAAPKKWASLSARTVRRVNPPVIRITHRIRVYMKAKA